MGEAKVADLADRSARNNEVDMQMMSNIPSPSMQDSDKEYSCVRSASPLSCRSCLKRIAICEEGFLSRDICNRVAESGVLKWKISRGDPLIGNDYEVLGLASDGRHYFWIFFLWLHGMSSQ